MSGVRESFETRPIRSTAAAAVFGASLLWGLKAAKNNGMFGAAVKGMIAVALMNKAKNTFINGQHAHRRALAL